MPITRTNDTSTPDRPALDKLPDFEPDVIIKPMDPPEPGKPALDKLPDFEPDVIIKPMDPPSPTRRSDRIEHRS